jgi:hypothetical protein
MNSNSTLFVILVVVMVLMAVGTQALLQSEEVMLSSLSEQFTADQIKEVIGYREKWQWLGYALLPFLLLIKILIIAAILDIGCFFFGKDLKYKTLFHIAVKAEFVFLLVIVFKTAWFYFVQTDYTLEDLQYFYPLSVLQVFGYEGLEPWFIYPLQVVNLFELCYWLLLGYGLSKALKQSMDYAMGIVASSYGVGLLIWVAGVMFFMLNMS